MASPDKKRTAPRFPVYFTIAFSLFLIVLAWPGFFQGMDNSWSDTMFQLRGMEPGDPHVIIVTIDDESIKQVGEYPWPRRVYKRLLSKLYGLGVEVVGLDIMFLDPSREKEDAALIQATRSAGDKLVHAMRVEAAKDAWSMDYVYPFAPLKRVAKSLGVVSQLMISSDGSVREANLLFGKKQGFWEEWLNDPDRLPAFGLAVLSKFTGKSPDDYVRQVGGNIMRLNLRGEKKQEGFIMVEGEQKLLTLGTDYGLRRVSAWKILEGDLDEDQRKHLKGSMVLVGSTAIGAYDHFPTPFQDQTPGVEVHANLIDNLLHGRHLRGSSPLVTMLLIVVLAFLAKRLTALSPLYGGLIFLGVAAAWCWVNYYLFLRLYLLEFTGPLVSMAGTFGVLMVHKTMLEQKQKKEVRQMFGQYVAPEVVDILVRDPDKIRLGGEKRDMTVFFLDIAHFTTISEKMTPESLIQFLNRYLTALTDNIYEQKGVVDKYIGDCIMAFWNAPLDQPEHRRNACLAAVGCVRTIERLNEEYVDPTMPETPAVRIGLNSGEVVVGNTGSARKLAYTVLGDEVNLASRLEGANKFFGSTIMASEDTYNGAKGDVEARVLGSVRVVGKDIPIKVFELLGLKGELSEEWKKALPSYHDGVEKYLKREFDEAKKEFAKVQAIFPDDKPAKLYMSVCDDYIAVPPPKEWDGVFNLTSK
ncbi:MAG: adenylate/guanylate cyclase domain-containing protein [Elusimicrobiota bacterium]